MQSSTNKFYLVGTNHFDIFGWKKLHSLFSLIKSKEINEPAFISTEFPTEFINNFHDSKNKFSDILLKRWPDISNEIKKLIIDAFMYELGAVIEEYPLIKILPLQKIPDFYGIDKYINDRVDFFSNLLREENSSPQKINDLALSNISDDYDNGFISRNYSYCDCLLKEIRNSDINNSYVLTLIGAKHVEIPKQNSMKDIITREGYLVEIIYL